MRGGGASIVHVRVITGTSPLIRPSATFPQGGRHCRKGGSHAASSLCPCAFASALRCLRDIGRKIRSFPRPAAAAGVERRGRCAVSLRHCGHPAGRGGIGAAGTGRRMGAGPCAAAPRRGAQSVAERPVHAGLHPVFGRCCVYLGAVLRARADVHPVGRVHGMGPCPQDGRGARRVLCGRPRQPEGQLYLPSHQSARLPVPAVRPLGRVGVSGRHRHTGAGLPGRCRRAAAPEMGRGHSGVCRRFFAAVLLFGHGCGQLRRAVCQRDGRPAAGDAFRRHALPLFCSGAP